DEADGVVAFEAGEQLHLGHEERAEAGDDLVAPAAQLGGLALDLVALLLGVLLDLRRPRLGLLDDELGARLGVLQRLARRLARGLEGLLQGFLHLLVVRELGLHLAEAVLQVPLLVEQVFPLAGDHLQERLHLLGLVPAEAARELLLANVERGKSHTSAWLEGNAGAGPASVGRPETTISAGRFKTRPREIRVSARRVARA